MKIRHPAWAGQFYPAGAASLQQMIDSYLMLTKPKEGVGRVVGLVSPHAGYTFSGRTAAAAYNRVKGERYGVVIVIAPSHGAFIDGVSVYDGDFYETPLGQIPVDKAACAALAERAANVHLSDAGHDTMNDRAEHSLEVQLPFLQVVLQDFQLVPLVFHDYSWENCRQLGEAIADVFDPDDVLIVASTDLYHGYSYEECRRKDDATLAAIEKESAIDFCYGANNGKYAACGAGPVTALKLAGEKWGLGAPRVIARTNSADVTGSAGGYVVGYAVAILEKKEQG